MLIVLILLLLVQDIPAANGSDYEPKIMSASSVGPVLLYSAGVKSGTTALRVDRVPEAMIRNVDGKAFTITAFTAISVNEAITAAGKVYAYLASENRINADGLKKLNGQITEGSVSFKTLLDSLDDADMERNIRGSDTEPDPKRFRTMRNVYVYTIMTRDSAGKTAELQVWIEQLTDITGMH